MSTGQGDTILGLNLELLKAAEDLENDHEHLFGAAAATHYLGAHSKEGWMAYCNFAAVEATRSAARLLELRGGSGGRNLDGAIDVLAAAADELEQEKDRMAAAGAIAGVVPLIIGDGAHDEGELAAATFAVGVLAEVVRFATQWSPEVLDQIEDLVRVPQWLVWRSADLIPSLDLPGIREEVARSWPGDARDRFDGRAVMIALSERWTRFLSESG